MAKAFRCSDIGMNCGWEAKAETEDELLGEVSQHAKDAHGMETIPPEVAEKVKAAIRDV